MNKYTVKLVDDAAELEKAEKLYVSTFRSGTPGYEPETCAQLVFLRDKGLLCRMESRETGLRAEVTEVDGDTYKDSCLEFFINFAPEKGDGYINLEGNPIGTLHCKFGKDRYVRRSLSDCGCALRPEAKVIDVNGGWGLEYFIPMAVIKALFGKDEVRSGDVFKANFYKCGDFTEHPHYGMWSEVKLEKLDFHRPDFFGELVLE